MGVREEKVVLDVELGQPAAEGSALGIVGVQVVDGIVVVAGRRRDGRPRPSAPSGRREEGCALARRSARSDSPGGCSDRRRTGRRSRRCRSGRPRPGRRFRPRSKGRRTSRRSRRGWNCDSRRLRCSRRRRPTPRTGLPSDIATARKRSVRRPAPPETLAAPRHVSYDPPDVSIDPDGLSGSASGDDVDDAGQGVRSVKRALGPAQDLDPLDVVEGQVGQVERARGIHRVVEGDAVEEDQDVLGIGAAQKDRGSGARAAVADGGDSEPVLDGVQDARPAGPVEIPAGEDGHGARDFLGRAFRSGWRRPRSRGGGAGSWASWPERAGEDAHRAARTVRAASEGRSMAAFLAPPLKKNPPGLPHEAGSMDSRKVSWLSDRPPPGPSRPRTRKGPRAVASSGIRPRLQ